MERRGEREHGYQKHDFSMNRISRSQSGLLEGVKEHDGERQRRRDGNGKSEVRRFNTDIVK